MGMIVNPYRFSAVSGATSLGPLLEAGAPPGTITLPAYSPGDVVFLFIFKVDAGGHAGSTTPPTGWTLAANLNAFSNTDSMQVFYKVMTGSEGSTVTHNWGTSGSTNAQALTVSGVNTGGSIIEGVATTSAQPGTAGTVNLTTASVTTLGAKRLIINFMGTARGTNGTMAESADAWTDIVNNNTSAQSLTPHTAISKQLAATAGTYTAETRTESQTVGGNILMTAISFAIILT